MDRLVFDFWTQSCVDQTVTVTVDCSATCAYRRTTASGYDVTGNKGGVSPSSHNPPGNLTVSSLPITNQNAPHKHTDGKHNNTYNYINHFSVELTANILRSFEIYGKERPPKLNPLITRIFTT